MNKILLLFLLMQTIPFFSQEDEDDSKPKFCVEIDNKKALKLYEKALDKKKYKNQSEWSFCANV